MLKKAMTSALRIVASPFLMLLGAIGMIIIMLDLRAVQKRQ